jgi:hypothetical protein
MNRWSWTAWLVALGASSAAACTSASDDTSGGDPKFDAEAPPPPNDCEPTAAPGAPATWSGLFSDYFGPKGQASCSSEAGNCHGAATDPGAKFSGGYVCAANKDECRDTMMTSGLVRVPEDGADPSKSGLVQELRRKTASGKVEGLMPKRPACVFQPAAIERIQTWIKNGAPND